MGWWTRGATVGRGSSATVSLATAVTTGELFAVKSNELSCSSLLQKEQSLISQLKSPYIVEYVGSDITFESGVGRVYNLLMEYMPGGTLTDLIKKQGGWLPESMIQLYAHQILQGLEYLHGNGIAHCDIKGQNILIGEEGVKIADLGCAKRMMETVAVEDGISPVKTKIISGTPIFMAPEVARGEEQGFPADIWAFGCTIIEMATGTSPWPDMNNPVSALYRIGYSTDIPEFPRFLSDNAKELLSNCLKRDAKERWTAKQLLQHPFFNGIEAKPILVRNSPTSILDQNPFWDSIEVSDEVSQESSPVPSSFSSPTDRIKSLIGDDFSNLIPDWIADDENWITVRSVPREENPQISEKNYDAKDQDSDEISIGDLLLLNSSVDFHIKHIIMYSDNEKNVSVSKIFNSKIKITQFNKNILLNIFPFLSFPLFVLNFQKQVLIAWAKSKRINVLIVKHVYVDISLISQDDVVQ